MHFEMLPILLRRVVHATNSQKRKFIRKTQKYRSSLSKCLLRHDVVRVFVSFLVFFLEFLYGSFCHGALKHDISTLFTTFFVWTSLQFILLSKRTDKTKDGTTLSQYIDEFSMWLIYMITDLKHACVRVFMRAGVRACARVCVWSDLK